jgi:hypothetical protein
VLRETLRLHAPVAATARAATRARSLRRSSTAADGRGRDRVRPHPAREPRRGDMGARCRGMAVRTAVRARVGVLSTLSSPERWTDGSVAERAKSIPGLWGSTLAFSGGSHSCIGYKFSLYECVWACRCPARYHTNANTGQSLSCTRSSARSASRSRSHLRTSVRRWASRRARS